MPRILESDEDGMRALYESLPLGFAAGPLQCPIGLDACRDFCSAGYCIGCQLDRHKWDLEQATAPTAGQE